MTTATPPDAQGASNFLIVHAKNLTNLQNSVSAVARGAECVPGDLTKVMVDSVLLDALYEKLILLQSRPVMEALRNVQSDLDANENDAILAILPPGLSEELAIASMNRSIERAAAETSDGAVGPYWESLEENLRESGIEVHSQIERLSCQPWDASLFPEQPEEDDPDWVVGKICPNPDLENFDPEDWQEVELPDGRVATLNEGVPLVGFVTEIDIEFPRSDRYGVPDFATDAGARRFIARELGLVAGVGMTVNASDSGVDSLATFSATVLMRRDCLLIPDAPVDHPVPRG